MGPLKNNMLTGAHQGDWHRQGAIQVGWEGEEHLFSEGREPVCSSEHTSYHLSHVDLNMQVHPPKCFYVIWDPWYPPEAG